MSETLRLLPSLRLVRRDADHLQLGVDPPRVAVLKDLPEVRRLVEGLAVGKRPQRLGVETSVALAAIIDADLLEPIGSASQRDRLRTARIRLEGPVDVTAGVAALLAAAGVQQLAAKDAADVVLLVTAGEVERARLDGYMRDEVPHLLVRDHGRELVVGPFVVPGTTACLRCVDCHHGDADPRRGLVVEQVATTAPLVTVGPDPTLRAVALSLATRDLVTFVEGGTPATWSATITVTPALELEPRRWLRHAACGCAWDAVVRTG